MQQVLSTDATVRSQSILLRQLRWGFLSVEVCAQALLTAVEKLVGLLASRDVSAAAEALPILIKGFPFLLRYVLIELRSFNRW